MCLDGENVGTLLQATGLEQVSTRPVLLPCGDYGGRVGKMLATDYISGAKGLSGVVIARNLATSAEFEGVLTAANAELAVPAAQCAVPFYLAFGRRRS